MGVGPGRTYDSPAIPGSEEHIPEATAAEILDMIRRGTLPRGTIKSSAAKASVPGQGPPPNVPPHMVPKNPFDPGKPIDYGPDRNPTPQEVLDMFAEQGGPLPPPPAVGPVAPQSPIDPDAHLTAMELDGARRRGGAIPGTPIGKPQPSPAEVLQELQVAEDGRLSDQDRQQEASRRGVGASPVEPAITPSGNYDPLGPKASSKSAAAMQKYGIPPRSEQAEKKGRNNLKMLTGMKNIAEGLGGFHAYSGAQIRSGVAPEFRPGVVAEDTRRALGEEEDKITPEQATWMGEALGMNPEDLTGRSFSKVESLAPAIVRRAADKALAKAAEQARQVAVRDLTIKEQRTREGLLAELSQRFTSDPDSRKIRQSIRSADTIMHLLGGEDSDKEVIGLKVPAIARKLSEASGDAGRLSNQDVEQFMHRRGWAGTIDKWSLILTDTASEDYVKNVKKLVTDLVDFNRGAMDIVIEDRAQRFVRNRKSWDFSIEEATSAMRGDAGGGRANARSLSNEVVDVEYITD